MLNSDFAEKSVAHSEPTSQQTSRKQAGSNNHAHLDKGCQSAKTDRSRDILYTMRVGLNGYNDNVAGDVTHQKLRDNMPPVAE